MRTIIAGLLTSVLAVCSISSKAAESELMATAPLDGIGLTVQKSPVLYYFISNNTSVSTRFILWDPRNLPPVAEVTLKPPTHPGLWAVRLNDFHIVLEEEVQYLWFVVATRDANSHKGDIVAGGKIERVSPQFVEYNGGSCDKKVVQDLLAAGVWYDAFACVNDLIAADPEDQTLRDLQGEVLKTR